MDVTNVDVGCLWRSNPLGAEEIASQVVAFARRLQQVDPVFAEIVLVGDRFDVSDPETWIRQPLVWDMTRDHWRELVPQQNMTTVRCWNRRLPDAGGCLIAIHVNNTSLGNGVTMNNIPPEVNNPQALMGILAALIESFRADQVQAYSALDMLLHPIWARHWRVWMRDGLSLPDAPDNRFKKEQGPYSSAEPWLGGTLYTWPEYEPWRYEGPGQS